MAIAPTVQLTKNQEKFLEFLTSRGMNPVVNIEVSMYADAWVSVLIRGNYHLDLKPPICPTCGEHVYAHGRDTISVVAKWRNGKLDHAGINGHHVPLKKIELYLDQKIASATAAINEVHQNFKEKVSK